MRRDVKGEEAGISEDSSPAVWAPGKGRREIGGLISNLGCIRSSF